MKTLFTIIACLLASTAFAQTQVPNSFTAGEPARASDVNENFSSLASAIDQIGSRVSSIENLNPASACSSSIEGLKSPHSVQYTPNQTAAVGSVLDLDAQLFMQVRIPFIEYGTGSRYTIDVPVQTHDKIQFKHVVAGDPQCFDLSIDGYPAKVEIADWRMISMQFGSDVTPFVVWGALSASRAESSLVVKVGATAIFIPIRTMEAGESVYVEPTQAIVADYTELLDTTPMQHPDDLLNFADEFIDYIRIRPAP